jgi:hypothetical protein
MSQTSTRSSPKLPPEPTWSQRYSPHHEFPLSAITSSGLHLLFLGLMALLLWLGISRATNTDTDPLPASAVVMDEPSGGGGGDPKGVKGGVRGGATGSPDAVDDDTPINPNGPINIAPVAREKLKEAREDAVKLPEFNDPDLNRLIEDGGKEVDAIIRLNKDVRNKLREGLAADKGKGGPGTGGGEGSGSGPGRGNDVGPGTGKNKREPRVLRWTLIFNTRDGNDYANQLAGLGAILAIPSPKDPNVYLKIDNLNKRPVEAIPEDLANIKRIYWVDDKAASVTSLARALGLPGAPPHVVAFFPESLESELLAMELKYRGLREEQIRETRFEIRRFGGVYRPVVVSQR